MVPVPQNTCIQVFSSACAWQVWLRIRCLQHYARLAASGAPAPCRTATYSASRPCALQKHTGRAWCKCLMCSRARVRMVFQLT